MSFTDEELIEGCRENNRQTQELLYSKYSKSMYVVALRYVKTRLEAEDIMQEAFIKVFQNIGKFRGDSSLPYWIKRIVVNTALNNQRSKLYLYPMVDVEDLKAKSQPENALSDCSYQELILMLQELPDGCRIIFNLYAIEGYKHYEIAEQLDISEGTSKSQYARAKSLLRMKLESRSRIRYGQAGRFGG